MGSLGTEDIPTHLSASLPHSSQPIIYVNGRRRELHDGLAETTLLEYLRDIGLPGTKLGCGEGGCGACTVMVSHYDHTAKKIIHRSVNACLAPLYSVEGMHVVTVEGIGNSRTGLHPVQERLAKAHGSQCGFCTPGFVMSMYALLRSHGGGGPSEEEIEENLAGNLCRCTGYRPILDAFRVFAKSDAHAYSKDSVEAAGGKLGGGQGGGGGGGICPSTGKPCDCGAQGGIDKPEKLMGQAALLGGVVEEDGSDKSGGVSWGLSDIKNGCCEVGGASNKSVAPSEVIFPPELMTRQQGTLSLGGGKGAMWFRPTSLAALLELKGKHPTAKLVVGNSEVGIEMKFKNAGYPVLIGTTAVPELNLVAERAVGMEFGAAVTLTRVLEAMQGAVKTRPPQESETCAAVVGQMRWFAGTQIRNVASLGGNVCTASPISDLNPLWMASRATFTVVGTTGKTRQVAAENFFLGYRQVDLKEGEVLLTVSVPWTRPLEYVKEFKQSHRREDDIAIVNAGMRVVLRPAEGGEGVLVSEIALAFGGVAARSVRAPKTEAFMVGKEWSAAVVSAAMEVLRDEILIPDSVPGGMPEFRRSLVSSFFFKFFLHVSFKLEASQEPSLIRVARPRLPASYRSAVAPYSRRPSAGLQYFEGAAEGSTVGMPLMHMSAELQVSGEAEYGDDYPMPANGLHGALVLSTRPHARILGIDTLQAEKCPGFAGFFSSKDVPGKNDCGAVLHDEEAFASEEVTCVGQIIGVVVADTRAQAKAAAREVLISYQDLPAVFSIQQAIAANSYLPIPFASTPGRVMSAGDVDACFAGGECHGVVEGSVQMGGQEQFYLEPHMTLAWTLDGGVEVCMISSTQAPTHHQKDIARLLGLPLHRVICKTKRIGGGFGGKETRSAIIAAAAALPAWHLNRPVKVVLDRDTDMAITGQRHPFLAKYKVGFSAEGKVLAVDLQLWNNGGCSNDLSHSILERAMFHSESVYAIPHLRINGRICRTNLPSNTAFRGFGGPQGLLVAESWMERIAREVGRPVEEVQEMNFHPEGHVVHYGQKMSMVQIQRIWKDLKASGEWEQRREAVDAFNAENRFVKKGLAMVPVKYGISFTTKFLNQGGALVHIYTDGTVLVTHGGVEMGQGLHTKVAQVASATLGIPTADVYIAETSTDKVPNTSPTAASAGSDIYGQATLNACLDLKERMKAVADGMPDATFAQVVEKCYLERISLSAQGFHVTPEIHFDWATGKGHPFAYHVYGASLAEVEIDTLTGGFSLPRVDIIMDLGKSINPAIDVGQVEGGWVQGLGWAVTEELKWGDDAHEWIKPGHLFTQGPGTYKLPTANDIPVDFRVTLLRETENPKAVLSSKAVGEPPLFLAASAVFALKDAILSARKDHGLDGFFVLDTPATPERVRMACADEITAKIASPDMRPKLSV